MPSKKVEQQIRQVQQHLEMLDEGRSDKDIDNVEREKRGLERIYLSYQQPHSWRIHARMLKRAADAVLDEYVKNFPWGDTITFLDADSVYVYLTGMAIENLLKGIYVARHPELITLQKEQIDQKGAGYKFNKDLLKHNLTKLAEKLKKHDNIEFTKDELDLIGLSERFVTWEGRYRIPKDSIKFVEAKLSSYYSPDGEWRSFVQGDAETFSANINKLYSRLDGILEKDSEDWRNIRGAN